MKKLVMAAIKVFLPAVLGLTWARGAVTQQIDARPRTLVAVAGVDPGALVLVDWMAFEVIRTVEGLADIHGAAISPDASRAYALSLSRADRALSVIDVATGKVVRVVELDAPAHHAAMEPSGRRLYVTFGTMGLDPARPRGIAAVGPEGGHVAVIATEGTPSYVAVAPDGSYLYATTLSPDRVLKVALPASKPHRRR
ncbi:MAG: YncE family protein [Gemmatimonadales bacterium]